MNHKKRKFNSDDDDRSLSHIFSVAATAVTSLYASAEREHKKARLQSRQLLERQFQWILRQYGENDSIPRAALLRFLQDQAQILENEENKSSTHGAQGGVQGLVSHKLTQPSAFQNVSSHPFPDDTDRRHL